MKEKPDPMDFVVVRWAMRKTPGYFVGWDEETGLAKVAIRRRSPDEKEDYLVWRVPTHSILDVMHDEELRQFAEGWLRANT